MYEKILVDVVLTILVAHPAYSELSIKYTPDKGLNDPGISDNVNS
jgi:hypothetical protein